jgi:hypothetical protein
MNETLKKLLPVLNKTAIEISKRLDFIKQSSEMLAKHVFFDKKINFAFLGEAHDHLTVDLIEVAFHAPKRDITLSKNDILLLAKAIGLKVSVESSKQ